MANVLGGKNPSTVEFRNNMRLLSSQMGVSFEERIVKTAEELAQNIRNATPKGETGNLAKSVRVINRSTKGSVGRRSRVFVWVMAGGEKTLRRTGDGQIFDYAIAMEFGTINNQPQPFFYNTWRRYKGDVFGRWQETFEQTIKENERIRAGKGQKSYNFTATIGREGTL